MMTVSNVFEYAINGLRASERDKHPGYDVSPARFNYFQFTQADPKRNSRQSQNNRTQDMAHSRKKRDPECFRKRPLSRFSQHNKWKVMIGTQ